MEKQQTSEKTSLIVKLEEPDKKIIQNWLNHEKKTIKAWCQKKISDFEEDDLRELEIRLIRLQRFVGTSRLLGDDEMEDLIEYLQDEFPDMATDEIDNAVKLAVAEKIVVTDARGRVMGAEHFNEFGALYLHRILKPYQNYRGSIIRKYYEGEEALRAAEKKKSTPAPTAEQLRVNAISHALSCFDSFSKEQPMAGLHLVFDTLQGEGLMKYDEARMQQFRDKAKENLEKEAKRGNTRAKSLLDVLKGSDIVSNSLDWDIKALAVKAYFSELIQMEAKLSDYLKLETPKPKGKP